MPSWSLLLSGLAIAYMGHSLWSLAGFFMPPACPKNAKCIRNFLEDKPKLQLLMMLSLKRAPMSTNDFSLIDQWENFDYLQTSEKSVNITLPSSTCRNGTAYLHVFIAPWRPGDTVNSVLSRQDYNYLSSSLTKHKPPEAEAFQLLQNEDSPPKPKESRPVTHIRSTINLSIMTELVRLPVANIPPDVQPLLRFGTDKVYLPMIHDNPLHNRLKDLVRVKQGDCASPGVPVTFAYQPTSLGKLRLSMQFSAALESMHEMGFSEKDTDEVKGIFADTNFYLLCVTVMVSTVHLLLDFLAFKNDISFWYKRDTMVGLSTRMVMWRAFSHIVIFLYLLEEDTIFLVLVPAGLGAVIEMWKVTKALRVRVEWQGRMPRLSLGNPSDEEKKTEEFDHQAMQYLSYLLYPLCILGAIYSLLYMPHKSWYSWCLSSLVNGVYALGFLFMLPQLFVNYRLKSVAHLPWRAFMYKAFNTFIDDIFAFIITMPTAHRVACFRDDVVFIVYLYQRWLYPVDNKRVNEYGGTGDDGKKKQD